MQTTQTRTEYSLKNIRAASLPASLARAAGLLRGKTAGLQKQATRVRKEWGQK